MPELNYADSFTSDGAVGPFMIVAILQYTRDEVRPRLWTIVSSGHAILSAAIAATVFAFASRWPIANLRVLDFEVIAIGYAAIVLTFSIAGMALVLTFPNQEFLSVLVTSKLGAREESAYNDLLFVFSWTAVIHWSLIAIAVSVLMVRGPEGTLLNKWDGLGYRLLVALLLAIAFYAVAQFLLTMITLTQVGRVYEKEMLSKIEADKRRRREFIERSLR